jgi:hypothetical protein
MHVRPDLFGGHSIVHMFSPVRRRGPTRDPMALAPAAGTRYRSGRQARWSRLLLLTKAAVSGPRLDRPLAAGTDDEEQPARHGSALAAARRRAWSSLANVPLLRLSEAVA